MRVELMVIEGCPHLARAESLLRQVLSELSLTERFRVTTLGPATPIPSRFGGSPTYVVDGQDLFEGGAAGYSCRRYPTADGVMAGVPERDALSRALQKVGPQLT